MTLDFPTRLEWRLHGASYVASLGSILDVFVAPHGAQWVAVVEGAAPTDFRTAILAAEAEALDLLCGALACVRPLPNELEAP